jgi:Protein of unknown function (DUF1116)
MSDLLDGRPSVVTVGAEPFADALRAQGAQVTSVDWRPPLPGTADALTEVLADPVRTEANGHAVEAMLAARPHLVDVVPAAEALGLDDHTFLHAGPPIAWADASGPLEGAILGGLLLEGRSEDDAPDLDLEPCHHRGAVGPMAGVVTPSMPVYVVEDVATGARSFSTLNEGLGKVLRYGAYGPEVIDRLRWMAAVLGPVLGEAIRRAGPIDLRALSAQALQMGDDGHNRNRAGTSLFIRALAPALLELDTVPAGDRAEVLRFLDGNDHTVLNLVMAAAKLGADAAAGTPHSSVVTTMARNGTEFGIRVAGTGDQWFTGPAEVADGIFLGTYTEADANPDIGDSAITETVGLGGFAMAAAPAIVGVVGGTAEEAVAQTRRMYEITLAEHPAFQVPILEFRGTPVAIDVTLVARTGILPVINTGIAGRVAGTGQVGAGIVHPPATCFVQALARLASGP